jgi:hypothetical protein
MARTVRLKTGALEPEESVGLIMVALRQLERDHPEDFRDLAKLCQGQAQSLTPAQLARLRKSQLLRPDASGAAEPYDDVRDVLLSALVCKGRQVQLGLSPLAE